ncbi:unnamed protein product [Rotaria sp. Silwood2]|nr:unnamed protein product [Rotaria sp. Silwood2]CAF4269666.1 unnamed protein product [Rotaria sp. Silwood2]
MASSITTVTNKSLEKDSNSLKQQIDFNRHIQQSIKGLANDFLDLYLDFQDTLPKLPSNNSTDEPYLQSMGSLDFKFLNNTPGFERIQLVLCGPNSSGKTTFLHSFLKIKSILPSGVGPVTARIVKFTYASPSNACIIVYPSIQQAYIGNHQEEKNISLASYFNNSQTDWKGIEAAIKEYVARPKDINEDEFIDWAKRYIEIRIPSSTLELNIDVYDTPGLLFHDHPILKANVQELVQHICPTTVFLYSNAAFAKDANECYLMLRDVLGDLEQPSIFYLNTKQDITTLFTGTGISSQQTKEFTMAKYEEILPHERLKRYQLLYSAVGIANNLLLIENNISIVEFNQLCDNFDISSIVGRSLLSNCAADMTAQACQRIVEYAMKKEMDSAYAIADSILAAIDNFFDFTTSASCRTKEQWNRIHSNAQKWGEQFFEKFQKELSNIMERINKNILAHLDKHTTNIIERAIKLDRYDDPLQKKTKDIVTKNIKDFIRVVLQEEVIKVAVNEIINQTKAHFKTVVEDEILVNTERNELLITAQQQVLMNTSSENLTQRNWLSNIVYQLSFAPSAMMRLIRGFRLLPFKEYWNKSTLPHEDKYDMMDTLDSFSSLIDESKRRDFAEEYLKRKRKTIEAQKDLYGQNLQQWIKDKKEVFYKNIQNNYKFVLSRLENRENAYKAAHKYFKKFAEIECKLVALKDLAKFNGKLPIIDESLELGHGTHFVVYPGEWSTEKNLAIKKLKSSSIKNYSYLQYLEAHYHRKVTRFRLNDSLQETAELRKTRTPHIVPLLYLFDQYSEGNMHYLWIFMPRYDKSLEEYLQDNISTIKPKCVLKIANDIIDALILLHTNDIVHRDIKAKNVLIYERNLECYLTDFGTGNQSIMNSTVVGTFPLAPEVVNSGSLYNGIAADIYSFGVFLYEILPKKHYNRPDSMNTIYESLKKIPLNPDNSLYEELILSCLKEKPEERPSTIEIKVNLEECLKILKEKHCIICEDNLRRCRFQPCKHKLVCEPCFNKLPITTNGRPNCIMCETPIAQWTQDEYNQTYFG